MRKITIVCLLILNIFMISYCKSKKEMYVSASSLYAREEPNKTSKVVMLYPINTPLSVEKTDHIETIDGKSDYWFKTDIGYVFGDYLSEETLKKSSKKYSLLSFGGDHETSYGIKLIFDFNGVTEELGSSSEEGNEDYEFKGKIISVSKNKLSLKFNVKDSDWAQRHKYLDLYFIPELGGFLDSEQLLKYQNHDTEGMNIKNCILFSKFDDAISENYYCPK
jgi:hypothetical protein